jgi:hypothetical protein
MVSSIKCPKIGMVPAINLKGIGLHAAVPAGLLKKGDVVVHHGGARYHVMKMAVADPGCNEIFLHLKPLTVQKYNFGELHNIVIRAAKNKHVGVSKNTLMKRYVNVRAPKTHKAVTRAPTYHMKEPVDMGPHANPNMHLGLGGEF